MAVAWHTTSPNRNFTDGPMVGVIAIRKAFTAGGGGAADDVTIYSGDVPCGCRILMTTLYVSTPISLATCTLRDATGGGGNALSDAFLCTAGGTKLLSALTATSTLTKNGTLVIRRSDNGVAGEIIILTARE